MERSKETQKWETSLHKQQQAEFVENLENCMHIRACVCAHCTYTLMHTLHTHILQ